MAERERERARTRRRRGTSPRALLVDGVFVIGMLLVTCVALWPLYRSTAFLVMAGVTLAVGIALAAVGTLRRWSAWTLAAAALLVFLVLGVPLAVPGSLTGVAAAGTGWLRLVGSVVLGWKQLATVSLPVGSYEALLAPSFLLLLAASVAAPSLAWRARRAYATAVIPVFVLELFAVVWGSSLSSPSVAVLGFSLPAPREALVGGATMLLAVAWLVWRALRARAAAVRLARGSLRVSGLREASGVRLRRTGLGVAMVAVAVVLVASALPAAAALSDRHVLRSAIDPELVLDRYPSPLSEYRASFDDDAFDADMLRVSGTIPAGARIRLATLPFYDGEVYRATDPTDEGTDQGTAFARVPSTLEAPETGAIGTARITIDGYRGPWLPTVDALTSLRFDGADAATLAEGFYYNRSALAGVDLAGTGLRTGDAYDVDFVTQKTPALSALASPGGGTSRLPAKDVPASLTTWVAAQDVSRDAAGLQELIDRLRARGYLSHSLEATAADGTRHSWIGALSGYTFAESRAGESVDRIDALFEALNDKQSSVGGSTDSALVAAVGDDEQFATAVALLAEDFGFPARVVLGYALDDTGDTDDAVPACTDGTCRGQNLRAWVEVQGTDGQWATVDSTPQHTAALSPDVSEQSDPEVPTEVDPSNATEQDPPAAAPQGGDAQQRQHDDTTTGPLWLWAALRISGLVLLALALLASPVLTVLGAKWTRRRSRRRAPDPVRRMTGGWDEYVDAALDAGRPVAVSATRTELAAAFATPGGPRLARLADRAVFDSAGATDTESEEYWRLVEEERAGLAAGRGRGARIRAALSLRSLTARLGLPGRRPRETGR